MPSLQEILRDPNYINANEATKRAIFERHAPLDQNYTGANEATQAAIRQRFGIGQIDILPPAPPPPEKQSAFRQIADVPLGIAKGAVQGVRMIADAFGAGSDTSKAIKSAETYLADLMSAQAKNDQQEISRIMKDAEDKGVLDQVKAALKAFTVAPVDTLSSALGTAAPVIVGALGAKVLGAGALVSTGVSALTGAGMGAGTVKGSIYEETKNTLKKAGASEEEAERRAQLAQEYGGKNLDQILLGTVLGGAAAVGPLEKGGAAILARRILGKTGVEATESVAEQTAKGALRRRAEAGLLEAVPEAVQAGQEQVAQNIALQREGFEDVPTFRGAFSAATMEALAGFGLGTTIGGGRPEAPTAAVPPSVTPEAPPVEVPTAEAPPVEAPPVEAPPAEPPVAETPPAEPPVETPPGTPPAEQPPTVEPPVEVPPAQPPVAETPPVEPPVTPQPPEVVTAQMLEDIGVKPTAAIVKRLDGKATDDPQVARELTNYAKLYAPEDVKPQILNFVQTLTPVEAPVETTEQRLVRQQQEVDVEAQRIEELNRKQGMPSPDRPKLEIAERPSIAEAPPPVTPRQELLAKQAEIDTRRLEAGLPTGAASETPGVQPAAVVAEETKPVPKIVDERPLATRAAKNRLLVMQNMLQNQGGDPASLTIVPHPTVEGKFAIQSLDVPTKLKPDLPRTAITRPETPVTIDAVNAYVEDQRRQNTPAARQFVSDFESGRITKTDVENAISAERKRAAPPLAVLPEGEIVAPPASRARPTPPLEAGPPVTLQQRVKRAAQTNEPLFVTTFEQDGRNVYSVSTEETLDAKQRIEVSLTADEQERADQAQKEVDAIKQESVVVPTDLTSQEQREKYISDRVAEITSKRIAAEQRLQNILRKPVERTLADVDVSKLQAPKPPTSVPPAPVPPAPTSPPTSDQPAALPKSALELSKRLPSIMDKADVRKANQDGDIKQLVDALKSSPNLVTRRIGELGQSIVNRVRLEKPGRLKKLNWAGQFTWGPSGEAIKMRPDHAGNEQVNAHEVVHALTVISQIRPVTDKQKKFSQDIKDLYQHVKKELKKKGVTAYGLQDELEFTAEAMSNPNFQFELMQIPYPGKKSAWSKFVKSVADLLGITNTNALTEVISLVEKIAETKAPRKKTTGVETIGGEIGAEERPSVVAKATSAGTPGQKALETISNMGMDVPEPDPTKLEKAKDIWQKAKEDPKLTAQTAARAMRNFLDKVETWSFSSDAKLNNDYRRAIISDIKQNEGVIGQLLEMSQSQAVHADALASQFMIEGGLKYNDELKKWESFDAKANFPALSKKLDEIGKQYNLSKEQIERVAHAYLVAKRLPGLIERNRQLDEEIAAEQATAKPDKKKIQDLEDKKVFISDRQLEQMEPGLSLGKTIPELNQVVNMWNDIRKNTIDVMVNSGLWSPEYAQAMWDNMDYVPYFREDQIENEKGPQEFIRGLQVKSKEFQLKGSEDAVHDVFDNMIRWTQYAINRSVRAHKALQMIDNSKDIKVGDRKMAEKVTEEKRGMNIVRVFRDGKQELYDMADPLYVQAFAGIQNVSIPTLKFMSKISDILRNSVVLYPLFSVAQVPQDSFAAMFTSGLKTQHALKIPYLAVKEFVKTLNRTSQTHETLKKFGATGVRDFSATVIRDDAEIYAGLKPPRGGWGKTKEFLSHISMAADNAVRQAVYEASIQQGVSRSEAIEKAFEVINFRRKGTSKMLNILGQTVPFFYAYLSAQRVAYKVLTGVGISPTDRAEAFKTLAMTSTAVATLSLLYAMANADDEDYMETPANIRDRTITIPGSGGVRIPLRPDFFLFPKIIAEHTYLLLSEQGYQDAAKFRTSMKDALISAIASPTPFPTAIKPAIEVAINYDFFQGKPLIGNFEKQKDLERQFRDSTSEFAKLLGKTGMISPIAADHLIRGMFGSFGGLFLFGTNQFLHSDPNVPRPEMNATEMLAALPGTSGLLKRPQESALKNDFYTLRDEVEKAVNTFNDIKTRSPEGMEAFLADEKQMARLMLGKPVDKINRELSKIRRQITIITNMPESQMSAADKADYKRELMEMERELLRSVNVKELREMAQI